MKKLLIISPHFPPINGADMHRIRQSLPYYQEYGWEPVVVTVDPEDIEAEKDLSLSQSIPKNIRVIQIKALPYQFSRKLGFGSLAIRSFVSYFFSINQLLKKEKFDLIFFSTTQFLLLILGNYWNRRFGIPYVIDMQDPWHTDYYLSKPANERPPKFWFSYYLDKFLEPVAMRKVASLLAVSSVYNETLLGRYSWLKPEQCHTLTFGADSRDFELALAKTDYSFHLPNRELDEIRIVYIGRGGHDMRQSLTIIFSALIKGLDTHPSFKKIKLYFIGTSYAPKGTGIAMIQELAASFGLSDYVFEFTDRIPYFNTLVLLKEADMLLVPGSDDKAYTASKIYPYILSCKPILAVFHSNSSIVPVIEDTASGIVVTFDDESDLQNLVDLLLQKWIFILENITNLPQTKWEFFSPHTAQEKARLQAIIFHKAASV